MTKRKLKKIVISVIGGTILLIGLIMIITPGPSILIIPAGLGILGTEYLWAKKLSVRFKDTLQNVFKKKA